MSELQALQAAVKGLAIDLRASELPEAVAAAALRAVQDARARIAPYRHEGPYAVEQLRPPSQDFRFDPDDPLGCIPYAPVLGRLNPASIDSSLRVVERAIEGEVTFSPLQAGPMNLVHGGALAALCDELCALAVLAYGCVGFTREVNVDFRAPARLTQPLAVRAFVESADDRSLIARAEVQDEGRVCVAASARFRKVGDLTGTFYDKPGAVLADRAK
jgi:acyl-coenzyme A thioesterase PaaI-like protein